MDKEQIKGKIDEAIEIVKEIEEPYRSIAFKAIFIKLFDEVTSSLPTMVNSSRTAELSEIHSSEFLSSLDLRSQLDQLEAIAYYFQHSKQESVTRTEIMETLSRARLARPKNISDVISKSIRRGHIIEAADEKEGQKALQITVKGEKHIEAKIRSESKP